MSRTDKDAPWWVQAEWWEPSHWRCGRDGHGHTRDCDLPAEPVRRRSGGVHPRWLTRCTWAAVPLRPLWSTTPPKWFLDHVGSNRTRTLLRSQLIRARKEHNGSGDTDVIANVDQHRQAARWLWW